MKLKQTAVFILVLVFLAGTMGLSAANKKTIDTIKFPPLNSIQKPEIIKDETANGIKLRLIKDDKLPLIELTMMIKGGNVYDPSDKVSLSDITAQLLRIGGTTDMKPDELEKALDSKGITIRVTADDDFYRVTLNCLKDNFDQAVELLAKILMHPAFEKEKMEEIKSQAASAINMRNDMPADIIAREFDTLIYGKGSPFAAVLEHEHLDNITRGDVAANYKRYFAPGNILAGIIGPIEMDEVKIVIEKHLGTWNNTANIPLYPQINEQSHDFKVAFAQKDSLNQSYISIGHLGIKRDYNVRAKTKVFNSIFAGGFSSRLVNRVRVQMGATYGIGGGIGSRRLYPGVTSFGTFTKSERTIETINAILEEIDKIRKEKVTPTELEEAKNAFLNSYVFEFRSPDRILRNSLQREFYGEPEDVNEKLVEDIKKVTADDVLEVAQTYLHPDKMIITIVGNEAKLKGKLSDLGTVKKLDISIKPPALKEKIPEATPKSLAKGKKIMKGLLRGNYKGYLKLRSIYQEGTMTADMRGQSLTIQTKFTTLYPDKVYMEMTVMGMKMEQIVNGNKGVISQMGKKQPMPADRIEKQKFSDIYTMFHNMNDYNFQYLKETEREGKKYDVIYIFNDKKDWTKFFINKATGFIEIKESMESGGMGGSGLMRSTYSDFKIIKGVPFAFKSEAFLKDKKFMSWEYTKVEINGKVDPSIFNVEIPEKEE